MTELKPCPFCGSNQLRTPMNVSIRNSKVEMKPTHVSCMECGADGPPITYVDDVVKAWNKRIDKEKP